MPSIYCDRKTHAALVKIRDSRNLVTLINAAKVVLAEELARLQKKCGGQ